ncbi:hypothetical protein [Photobacterium gaetbulicola]|uniref:hypothetical protein n=1 Tax=Photobacterium gaetbulicola TaxID=1295392 RepID=UPI0005CB9D45|nr:hypothetical protein [Photobacterium gaetbulicola]
MDQLAQREVVFAGTVEALPGIGPAQALAAVAGVCQQGVAAMVAVGRARKASKAMAAPQGMAAVTGLLTKLAAMVAAEKVGELGE